MGNCKNAAQFFRRPTREEYERLDSLREPSADAEPTLKPCRTTGSPLLERLKAEGFQNMINLTREKFIAMVACILDACALNVESREISRVKLYKLLFYCDFVHCKKHGIPISGIPYVHLQNGPVSGGNVSYTLFDKEMQDLNVLRSHEEENEDFMAVDFSAGKKARDYRDKLSPEEHATLRFVLDRFRHKSASDLRRLSHDEEAYRMTADNEVIDYAMASSLSVSIDVQDEKKQCRNVEI